MIATEGPPPAGAPDAGAPTAGAPVARPPTARLATAGAPVAAGAASAGGPSAGGAGGVRPALPAIELTGVAKEFGSRDGNVQAVEQVDLAIAEGEFFSLLGPSGCGKTTTLRMVAGFEAPTRGRILLYGEDMVGVPPNRRDVNLVFQNYALFPHMSVAENVAFGLRRKRVAKAEVLSRVGEMLSLVQLEGRENRRPKELSGGQQQRVALARALVNRPRALLLDEPLGALDLKLRQSMQIELKRIQREVGITFVYVTHDQGEALTMSDRLVVMNAGRIEQLGSPQELYESPRTRFVAGFIGTSNLLSGRIDRVVDGAGVLEVGAEERVVVPLRWPAPVGGEVELTVRPEKISLSTAPAGTPGCDCVLRGTVSEVVYLGSTTHYTVRTALGDDLVVQRQNLDAGQGGLAEGAAVWVAWRPEHSYQLTDQPAGGTGDATGGAGPGLLAGPSLASHPLSGPMPTAKESTDA
ncbi:MAG: ABC transporter ATP-binding protein [Acidimicrobiales bacterium]